MLSRETTKIEIQREGKGQTRAQTQGIDMTKQERLGTGGRRKSKSRELRYFSLRCGLQESIGELEGMGDLLRTNCTQNCLSESEKIAKKKKAA
jgi:hypothetical protein